MSSRAIVCALFRQAEPGKSSSDRESVGLPTGNEVPQVSEWHESGDDLAHCFLQLANLPSCPLDRLSRYEATLWRQAGRIIFALDALDRRKPHERRRCLSPSSQSVMPEEG